METGSMSRLTVLFQKVLVCVSRFKLHQEHGTPPAFPHPISKQPGSEEGRIPAMHPGLEAMVGAAALEGWTQRGWRWRSLPEDTGRARLA